MNLNVFGFCCNFTVSFRFWNQNYALVNDSGSSTDNT